MRVRSLLAALGLVAFAATASAQDTGKAPDCGSAPNTVAMNACYKAVHDAADAMLNQRYNALMARLGTDDQTRLRDVQRAWVAFRDKQCAFETASHATGSIYPVLVATCLTELTQARTATFEHYLNCPSGDTSCVPLTEAAAQPAPAASSTAAAPCRQTAGAAKAQQYVQHCTEVSPATHPPCNAQNTCGLIIDEIKRGCAMIGAGAPAFCTSYK